MFSRRPLLILITIVVLVIVLRAFLKVLFEGYEIRMLTFNIFYPAEKMQERMEALGQIVEDLNPDFLLFQEVTLVNLALLRKQRWFSRFHLIPPEVTQRGDHFVVTLSRYPVNNWKIYPFKNSPFDRHLLVVETNGGFPSKNIQFVVANTHLEHGKDNIGLREEHLGQSLKILSEYENVCVMGDMNIRRNRDGDVVLPSPWFDVWLSLPGNDHNNGYTLANERKSPTLQGRVDRVYCKLSDFEVITMRIVDDQYPIPGTRPSDHFGLFTILELSSETVQNHGKNSEAESKVYFKTPPEVSE